jgi:hypothetical protein
MKFRNIKLHGSKDWVKLKDESFDFMFSEKLHKQLETRKWIGLLVIIL